MSFQDPGQCEINHLQIASRDSNLAVQMWQMSSQKCRWRIRHWQVCKLVRVRLLSSTVQLLGMRAQEILRPLLLRRTKSDKLASLLLRHYNSACLHILGGKTSTRPALERHRSRLAWFLPRWAKCWWPCVCFSNHKLIAFFQIYDNFQKRAQIQLNRFLQRNDLAEKYSSLRL